MACITLNIPQDLLNVQNSLGQATDTMLALTGESCNIFGALGLGSLEAGIQGILGTIGSAMGAVNNALAQIQGILNSVLDTALGAITNVLNTVLGGINQIFDFAQNAIASVTSMIDNAIGVLAQRANFSQILACAGVLGQLGAFPANTTASINQLQGLLSSGNPIGSIADTMIAGAKNAFSNSVTSAVNGLTSQIATQVNGSQDLINLNVDALRGFSCVV